MRSSKLGARQTLLTSALLGVFVLGAGAGCKDKLEDLPAPTKAEDEWIDQIGSEDGGDVVAAAAEPVAEAGVEAELAAPPAVIAGETEGELAGAGEDREGEDPAGEGQAVAAAGDAAPKAEGGSPSPAAAPSASASKDGAGESEAEEAEAEAEEPSADAPVEPIEPAPAAEPAPEPEPPKPAPPPPITMADYTGTWVFSGGAGQKQKLAQAIEDAAQQVPGIIRGIARKRLTKTQILETPVKIKVSGDQVTFNWQTSGNSMVATIDGPTSTMKYSGDKYKVKVRSKGSKLITTFMASDATKTIVYVLKDDRKRMTVYHRLVADQLDTPVTFSFSYRRQ